MAEDKKTAVTINDVEYFFEDMTTQQQAAVNHIADLDRKIRNAQFNLEQLQFGRDSFMSFLTADLAKAEEEAA